MKAETRNIILGVVGGFVLGVLIMMLLGEDKMDSLSISGGNGEAFSLSIKGKESLNIAQDTILDNIWRNTFSKDGLIGWLKKKNFIDLENDVEAISNKIKSLSPDKDLSKRILQMKNQHVGPFQIIGAKGSMSVPDYNVPAGTAYTWRGSKYDGKFIEVSDTSNRRLPIILKCKQALGAMPDNSPRGMNFFHVNKDDFFKLMPNSTSQGAIYFAVVDGPDN